MQATTGSRFAGPGLNFCRADRRQAPTILGLLTDELEGRWEPAGGRVRKKILRRAFMTVHGAGRTAEQIGGLSSIR